MFSPNCVNLEVRVQPDLPADCGGGVCVVMDSIRWLFVEPPTWGDGLPELVRQLDAAEWRRWSGEVLAAGGPLTALDLAAHFEVPPDVALWMLQEYAAAALLRLAAA